MFDNIKCITANFPWDWFWFLLLPLLLLWWWLNSRIKKQQHLIGSLEDRINYLEGELDACRKTKVSVTAPSAAPAVVAAPIGVASAVAHKSIGVAAAKGIASVEKAVASVEAAVAAPFVAAAAFVEDKLRKDDLKVVEGIGPKIEELFNNEGIHTFAALATTPVARLKSILDAAGSRFQIHDPATWPDQSALARDGKWEELKVWQDELNKGRKA